MEISINFRAPLVACYRADIEGDLEEWLQERGEIIGAGSATDGSWSHIDIDMPKTPHEEIPSLLESLRRILRELKVPEQSDIFFLDDEQETLGQYPVYD